jgi:hypothetical protein
LIIAFPSGLFAGGVPPGGLGAQVPAEVVYCPAGQPLVVALGLGLGLGTG